MTEAVQLEDLMYMAIGRHGATDILFHREPGEPHWTCEVRGKLAGQDNMVLAMGIGDSPGAAMQRAADIMRKA